MVDRMKFPAMNNSLAGHAGRLGNAAERVGRHAHQTSFFDCDVFQQGKRDNVRETRLASGDADIQKFVNRFEADGMTFHEPDEYMFSFNSPLGACPVCGGLGKIIGISEDLVIPDKTKSIYDGAIACWKGEKMGWFKDHLVNVAGKYNIPVFEPYCNCPRRSRL